jgi:hypothetical protein
LSFPRSSFHAQNRRDLHVLRDAVGLPRIILSVGGTEEPLTSTARDELPDREIMLRLASAAQAMGPKGDSFYETRDVSEG